MKNPIQRFSANTEGRDFVIGDVHGAFTTLQHLLENLKFDKTKDRLFSVGDLIDRGPQSLETAELLHEPWFHSVLANHEQMMLEAFVGGPLGYYWYDNGGYWGAGALKEVHNSMSTGAELSDEAKRTKALLPLIKELPYLITVDRLDESRVHIIHAELPPQTEITDTMLEDPATVMSLAQTQTHNGDMFVWGRYKFYSFFRANLQNLKKLIRTVRFRFGQSQANEELSPVVSGHTIVQAPLTILGQTNIDTGAYETVYEGSESNWCALTALELNTWKFYQSTGKVFREVQPVVINRADILKEPDNDD